MPRAKPRVRVMLRVGVMPRVRPNLLHGEDVVRGEAAAELRIVDLACSGSRGGVGCRV